MSEVIDFSAKAPSLGYFYQIRYGLYLLIKKDREDESMLKIECLDDISLEQKNEINLLQTKLHINKSKDLTDSSPDFWKTIRVWSESITVQGLDPDTSTFCLITTQKVSEDSFLKSLTEKNKMDLDDQDFEDLISKMVGICNTSKNASNEKAYEAFKKLTEKERKLLVKNIHILDSEVGIDEIEKNIKHELRLNTTKERIPALFERLEGWWFGECIDHLLEKKDSISVEELFFKVVSLTDELKADNLPVDFPDPIELEAADLQSAENIKFLRQLKLVRVGKRGQLSALSDYRRAYNQKSRWTRDHLVNPQEIIEYDKKLFDYWKRRFDHMVDKVESDGLDEEKQLIIGKEFYEDHYVNNSPPTNIRERFSESYLPVGGSHILADDLKIGWHPDYINKMKDE